MAGFSQAFTMPSLVSTTIDLTASLCQSKFCHWFRPHHYKCRPPARWVYADEGAQRHDPSHLLTRRLQAPLPALAAALEAGSGSAGGAGSTAAAGGFADHEAAVEGQRKPRGQQGEYAVLLAMLDGVTAAQIDASLEVWDLWD